MLGRRDRRRVLLGLLVFALLASVLGTACRSRDDDDGVGTTVPPGGTSTTTSTSVVSYDVPAVIDLPYVQRVVSAYDHALGDAIRVLVRDRALSDEFLKYLVGLYTEEEFEFQQKAWAEELQAGFPAKARATPGDPQTSLGALKRASPNCIVIRADRSLTNVLRPGEPQSNSAQDNYLVLVPKEPTRDPANVNPTPFAIAFDGFKSDNSVPEDKCVG